MASFFKKIQKVNSSSVVEVDSKEALSYYSATQWQLMWWRFKHHRVALIAGSVLIFMAFLGLFANFLAPYAGGTRNSDYLLLALPSQ